MHYFEKNVVEIKQEYTNFLTNIMTPLVYEGIKDIYNRALSTETKFKEAATIDPHVQNPGVLKIFQTFLKDIQSLNKHMIQMEYERIKERSKCSDWFDDLVKAVVKSNIILLTYNASGKKCKLVKEKYHEKIEVQNFVHKSYIECARMFYNYPEIFYHKYSTIEIKRNQREAYNLIRDAIVEAIRKMLPVKLILEEYLKNDYVDDNNDISSNIPHSRYTNLKTLLKRKILDEEDNIEDEYHDDNSDQENKLPSESRYSNSYHKILDDDTEIEEKIDDIDKEIDMKDKNENMSENLNNLIYGKEETNITQTDQLKSDNNLNQDENKKEDIKSKEINDNTESIKENNKDEPKIYDYSKAAKLLENLKKPKDPLADVISQYKKNISIGGDKSDTKEEIFNSKENKINKDNNKEKFKDNLDYTETNRESDKKTDKFEDFQEINIKVDKKVDKKDVKFDEHNDNNKLNDKDFKNDYNKESKTNYDKEIKNDKFDNFEGSDIRTESQNKFFDKLLK